MSQHVAHRHSDEIHELRSEIERLKAALQEITTTDPDEPADGNWFLAWKHLVFKLKGIARRALEQARKG